MTSGPVAPCAKRPAPRRHGGRCSGRCGSAGGWDRSGAVQPADESSIRCCARCRASRLRLSDLFSAAVSARKAPQASTVSSDGVGGYQRAPVKSARRCIGVQVLESAGEYEMGILAARARRSSYRFRSASSRSTRCRVRWRSSKSVPVVLTTTSCVPRSIRPVALAVSVWTITVSASPRSRTSARQPVGMRTQLGHVRCGTTVPVTVRTGGTAARHQSRVRIEMHTTVRWSACHLSTSCPCGWSWRRGRRGLGRRSTPEPVSLPQASLLAQAMGRVKAPAFGPDGSRLGKRYMKARLHRLFVQLARVDCVPPTGGQLLSAKRSRAGGVSPDRGRRCPVERGGRCVVDMILLHGVYSLQVG